MNAKSKFHSDTIPWVLNHQTPKKLRTKGSFSEKDNDLTLDTDVKRNCFD